MSTCTQATVPLTHAKSSGPRGTDTVVEVPVRSEKAPSRHPVTLLRRYSSVPTPPITASSSTAAVTSPTVRHRRDFDCGETGAASARRSVAE
ncbi:MAG: hypothetical protein QM809_06515 [Gordonia sp. (in: high G+C Gram-positive bacteria)]|uniref:hypothetical protein n=1 Tax=Gordonia sp. (in: high G+C Gram-positive bacteria) TaxID=84139 RepID=UPI0039E5C373